MRIAKDIFDQHMTTANQIGNLREDVNTTQEDLLKVCILALFRCFQILPSILSPILLDASSEPQLLVDLRWTHLDCNIVPSVSKHLQDQSCALSPQPEISKSVSGGDKLVP